MKRRRLIRRQLDPAGDVDDGLLGVARGGLGQDLPNLTPGGGHQPERRHHAAQRPCRRAVDPAHALPQRVLADALEEAELEQ